jgi:superfamily II DNA or RNA helicase
MAGAEVHFEVGNTWTSILQADEFILRVLEYEASYPTPQALAMAINPATGQPFWRPPPGEEKGWDGWIRLLRRPKTMYPYFPTGLLPMVTRVCTKFNYQPHVLDTRRRPAEEMPEFPKVELRDYQEAAVEAGLRLGRGVFDMPPRSGKTRTMLELHRRLGLPTIWIAPTDRIVQQTARVIEDHFGRNYVYHLVGTSADKLERAARHKVVVCTSATAGNLAPEFYAGREMLVVDEWHHTAAKTYTNEIIPKCDHIYYRYGMTGTFFRSGHDAMAMHALLSNTIFKVSSEELLRRGFLVPTKVVFVPVPRHPKLRGAGNQFSGGFGQAGIHEHKVRNHMVAQAALLLYQRGMKVLVLVGTKAQGRELDHILGQFLPKPPAGAEFDAVEFLSTDRPRDIQTRIIDSFLADQEVKVLMGTSLLGEGVDLPSVDALVYARGEKAEVSMTQNAYRVCTAVPGKTTALIVDFADRHHKRLMAHSEQRMLTYHAEPTFEVSVLYDFSLLSGWLQAGMPPTVNFFEGAVLPGGAPGHQ